MSEKRQKLLAAKRARKAAAMKTPGYKSKYALKIQKRRGRECLTSGSLTIIGIWPGGQ